MFGVLFELFIFIFCLRDADLKPLLHTVTFPVSAGERGVCPKACRCIYSLHLTGGSLVELRVSLHGVHSVTEGECVGVGCRVWFGIGPISQGNLRYSRLRIGFQAVT